jgi:peptidoglycan-associated lipoprotein
MDRLHLAPVTILLAVLAVAACSSAPRSRGVPPNVQARPAEAPSIEATNAVPFEAGRAELTGEARRRLEGWATGLRRDPAVKLTIIGHGDRRNTRDYDLALGAQRAEAVKNYLVALGVDETQLYTTSYGKESPAIPSGGDVAQAIDSRATVVVESLAEAPSR